MTGAMAVDPKTGRALNPKAAVPVLLTLFVFSLVIDNGFKLLSPSIASSTSPIPRRASSSSRRSPREIGASRRSRP